METVRSLSCKGLGYCCPWCFFAANRVRSGLIAARLGVTKRAASKWKSRFLRGELECEKREECFLKRLEAAKRKERK